MEEERKPGRPRMAAPELPALIRWLNTFHLDSKVGSFAVYTAVTAWAEWKPQCWPNSITPVLVSQSRNDISIINAKCGMSVKPARLSGLELGAALRWAGNTPPLGPHNIMPFAILHTTNTKEINY